MKKLFLFLLLLTPMLLLGQTIIYVNASNTSGTYNGTSWATAYTDLTTAITNASGGNQIWVAAGTYKPTTTTDRTISFSMKEGVAIYGGFAGGEATLSSRDIAANITILSGDLDNDGLDDGNSCHGHYRAVILCWRLLRGKHGNYTRNSNRFQNGAITWVCKCCSKS